MLDLELSFTPEEVSTVATLAGISAESYLEGLRQAIQLVWYEERKMLLAAAVRSGVLDLDTAKEILTAWKPGTE